MDQHIYAAFLIGVGRNSVTFATYTHYLGQATGDAERRRPSILPADAMQEVLYRLDRGASVIFDWPTFYGWLGRNTGTWAAFPQTSASLLVPHWFSDTAEYVCQRNEKFPAAFVDVNSGEVPEQQFSKFSDLTGTLDSVAAELDALRIRSNLVLTQRPIFILEPDMSAPR